MKLGHLQTWLDLESAIQSEVSQKEKNKYRILMHIYMESKKMIQMNLFVGQEQRHRCREWVCGHRGGRGVWDELGDQDWHKYTTM